jgi:hypothetical protein
MCPLDWDVRCLHITGILLISPSIYQLKGILLQLRKNAIANIFGPKTLRFLQNTLHSHGSELTEIVIDRKTIPDAEFYICIGLYILKGTSQIK